MIKNSIPFQFELYKDIDCIHLLMNSINDIPDQIHQLSEEEIFELSSTRLTLIQKIFNQSKRYILLIENINDLDVLIFKKDLLNIESNKNICFISSRYNEEEITHYIKMI
jgi:hypothetical protein